MFNLQMAPPHTIEDGIGAAWSKSGAWLRWAFATEGSDVAKDLVNHLFYMVALSIGTITAHLAGLKYIRQVLAGVGRVAKESDRWIGINGHQQC